MSCLLYFRSCAYLEVVHQGCTAGLLPLPECWKGNLHGPMGIATWQQDCLYEAAGMPTVIGMHKVVCGTLSGHVRHVVMLMRPKGFCDQLSVARQL